MAISGVLFEPLPKLCSKVVAFLQILPGSDGVTAVELELEDTDSSVLLCLSGLSFRSFICRAGEIIKSTSKVCWEN